jgi:predicted membrane protein
MLTNTLTKRTFFGFLLVAAGVLILLKNFDLLPHEIYSMFLSWQTLLMVIGLFLLMNNRNHIGGIITAGVGAYFFVQDFFPQYNVSSQTLFAVIVLGIGFYILLKPRRMNTAWRSAGLVDPPDPVAASDDVVDITCDVGEVNRAYQSKAFSGGNITVVMGGVELDLTACILKKGENVLRVFILMGGLELTIPKEWRVKNDVHPILGGFSEAHKREFVLTVDPVSTLTISGTVIMGGGEINFK